MAQLIKPDPTGDTPKVIEDKVRALPANQGLNEWDMWQKIEVEYAAAKVATKLKENVAVPAATSLNRHGNK